MPPVLMLLFPVISISFKPLIHLVRRFFFARNPMLVAGYGMLDTGYWMLDNGCSSLDVNV